MENKLDDLVGLYYPIKDLNNNEVAVKSIKKVIHLSNVAAMVVFLTDNTDTGIFIGYTDSMKLIDRNKSGEFKNLIVM